MSQKRETLARQKINQRLTESGEKERLQEMLRVRLIECGWRDELKEYARDIVKEKGVDNVTVDDLVAELTPQARSSVPDEVKKELLDYIRTALSGKP
ncbi:transcription and mRNA export factor ENY2-like [Hydractinia symbiolongicarpus]|uniref:transcription and mRNA export factor ENY2-like n=1 Tax=Hydractinia symbiolongicarpus TaxID=13093 RepID=UPI00254FC76A|nr:transcription and mRNA export factor ENY2-like [Hydractinia symbiolongicarpus]XP_057302947.1 transcription and mRNA export factor ENY2-like [Hydractinia symbiolongicarpus]